ncbi:MAG: glutamate synthase large subunit [Acidimicrobiales bacterium]|nr:glutamate synthase large subunit [Acidimicrobiales bacterium]MDP6298711.1 glutamate synthase large subunit [Acidimicrobiales bacterium]
MSQFHFQDLPSEQGLYHPALEHDSCGVNFLADLRGRQSHDIVSKAIAALCQLQHRGALGAEKNTGDGAGILIQIPDKFLRDSVNFELPLVGSYATGIAFMPQDETNFKTAKDQIAEKAAALGMLVLGWRNVPIDSSSLGKGALGTMPKFVQIFLSATGETGELLSGIALDRKAYILRKRCENEIQFDQIDVATQGMGGMSRKHRGVYFPSLSCRTFVYKGMLTTPQLSEFYLDLADERVESALALVHSRFSTNTFPSWPLAHPYRYVAHNGEINTVQGNRNWMRAREALMQSDHFGDQLENIFPICTPGASDTAAFDECLELLVLAGYSLPEAVLMMIPEPWENHQTMGEELKNFYKYHSARMEPWDGPASIIFTDGSVVGAVLDRNGLRPSRYWVTDDDLVIMASEVGVVDIDSNKIVEKGRLQPGKMFFIDTVAGRIVRDEEIKNDLASSRPYSKWIGENELELEKLADRQVPRLEDSSLLTRQKLFGYTKEEIKLLLAPMYRVGKEAIGSMGTDTPIAVLSNRPRLVYDYFQQLFAQVTNPPLDAMREEIVTSTCGWLGPEQNLLETKAEACRRIYIEHPVILNRELLRILDIDGEISGQVGEEHFRSQVIPCVYPVDEGGSGLRAAIQNIRALATRAIKDGRNLIVLSDRGTSASHAPIPALLATAAVHHHLVREKTRSQVSLIIETGEMREVHHLCLLLGYGANAVNPYLAFETITDLVVRQELEEDQKLTVEEAHANYVNACDKGVLKVMSKMGISTVRSYIGSQIFESIGLGQPLIIDAFPGTMSRLGGIGYSQLAEETRLRHQIAFPKISTHRAHRELIAGGEYQWRREGEFHLFNPETVFKLQHATREKRYDLFTEYTNSVNSQSRELATLRGLFKFRFDLRDPIPVEEVEPISEIMKTFSTGAMSYGSISEEAHETLAIAMNRIGAKSNTGEGGENPNRFLPDSNGDLRRSAIKQTASGRFGVTSEYLVNADDIQIKMAQGAKPGEGGQLPGRKVWPWIAEVRHSTPGVDLISPPPHHDIYSIEDLAQLIHDLKNANPEARIHVKLVSELGVGTVAAGVAKAHADVVLISGHDGGTGASPLTSIKHAGTPWELGLAETQQTLLLNNLRDRIVVQCDGQLKTGRDVVIAALLGAEEFGFATAPLVVMGCVMMRVCHLDTCPVGIATQNPELRENFSGKAEFVVNFMEFIAEEVRELLAALGFRSLREAIGQAASLDVTDSIDHWKAEGLDLSPILYQPPLASEAVRYCKEKQDHGLEEALDQTLIQLAEGALRHGDRIKLELPIRNVNRSVGTMLGYHLTKRWGGEGLPDDTIQVNFVGSAGNSFAAFMPSGITLRLEGDANDYVGKGLSGGRVVLIPPSNSIFKAEENVIAGNVLLYGATSGEMFIRGLVGERFAVRNSGALAVVEGIGDHGCEYMTGGRIVVLGATGRNFAAGMSGGVAFIYDEDETFSQRVNTELVDLEALESEDISWLRETIAKHQLETDSSIAKQMLDKWPSMKTKFVKVMPRHYKRVLDAIAEAEAAGTDPTEAVMSVAKGN